MDKLAFWQGWFGVLGREMGNPARIFTDSPEAFIGFCLGAEAEGKPAYVSVNPFIERDVLHGLEKLFFDFDNEAEPEKAIVEALEFAGALGRYYGVKPLVVASGGKGAHVYVWFNTIITGDGLLLKRFLEKAVGILLYGLKFKTLDRSASIDIKRLARVPYTVHNKTGRLCQPIGKDGEPLELKAKELKSYHEAGFGDAFIREVARRLRWEKEAESQKPRKIRFNGDIRPEVQALIEKARSKAHLTHRCYLIILFELINSGWGDEEIHGVFKEFFKETYNERRTQYFIDHARKRGYLPFKTCNITQELEGA